LCSKIMRRKAYSRELKMQLHASTHPDKAIMEMHSDKGWSLLRNICIFILFYLLIVE
jgi:transposase